MKKFLTKEKKVLQLECILRRVRDETGVGLMSNEYMGDPGTVEQPSLKDFCSMRPKAMRFIINTPPTYVCYKFGDQASLAKSPALGAGNRRFESFISDQISKILLGVKDARYLVYAFLLQLRATN